MRRFLSLVALMTTATGGALAQFTAGNLAVARIGDGSAITAGAAAQVSFIEFTTTGSLSGFAVNLPTTGVNRLTTSSTATSEGHLTLSANGQYLTYIGYDSDATIPAVATDITVPRAVVRVDATGALEKQILNTTFVGGSARSVVSDDGTNLWMGGASNGTNTGTAGVIYGMFGSPDTIKQTNGTLTNSNSRVTNLFEDTLFFSTQSGTPGLGIWQVGSFGTPPTTGAQTLTQIVATGVGSQPADYFFIDADSSSSYSTGDVFYIADERSKASGGGLQKWIFSGATFSLAYTLNNYSGTVGLRGLTASVEGNTVSLFATTGETTANRVITVTDALPTAVNPNTVYTNLLTADANTVFRGLDFVPMLGSGANIPEPATLALLGMGLLALVRRPLARTR